MPDMAKKPASKKVPAKPSTLSPYGARVAKLRTALRTGSGEVSHALITNPIDVAYLTGFLGGDSYLLLSANEKTTPIIISDARFDEELEPQRADTEVFIRKGMMWPSVVQLLRERDVARLGVQSEDMTLATFESLEHQLQGTGVKLGKLKGLVGKLRAIKDDSEVALISKAIKIGQDAMKAILPKIKVGLTELQVAAMLEAAMKERGSSQPAFESIVGARANGSLPHYRPHAIKLAKNQPLLIDWGAKFQGYHGDMTRTFCLGKWPKVMEEIYKITLDAHKLSAAALRPGILCRDVDAVARNHIKKHNYGEKFGHSLGHGLGMNVHEEPRVSHLAGEQLLEVGNVVTIEPGIYLPGIGGVRIEDDYLITKDGAKNLCSLPKDLKFATL
jgi:Xaa-Pro aminopeptidase